MCPQQLHVSIRLLFFCLLTFSFTKSSAQTCIPNFYKTYGGSGSDEGLDVVNTVDGGSIVAGRTTSGGNGVKAVLMKLDQQGSIQWTKSYEHAAYSELSKIKQASDGGYIAAGGTAESNSTEVNAWIIRTDKNGTLLWSQKLASSFGPTRVKDVMQLSDGSILAALNANDSTAQSDGILIRIANDGKVLWSRSFDNGNSDGIHSVAQDGDFILAGGYTRNNDRDGFVMKLNLGDGTLVWSQKIRHPNLPVNHIVRLDVTPKGYMIALVAKAEVDLSFPGNVAELFVVRIEKDTSIKYLYSFNLDAGSPYMVGNVALKFAGDSTFSFTVSDTLPSRSSIYRKLVISGFSTGFGGKVDGFHRVNSLEGIDPYQGHGVVLAGTLQEWDAQKKIQVVKTDWQGNFGPCTGNSNGVPINHTRNLLVTPFTWNSSRLSAATASGTSVKETSIKFIESTVCKKEYCVPASSVNTDECNSTLLAEYWNKYQLLPVEAVKVADGYIMCGSNRTTGQPVVIKVGLNGKAIWSKSINSDHHVAAFEHMRLTNDGNILLSGRGGYTVDHSAHTISVFVKMSPAGEVIWAKYIHGFLVDLKPTGDGSFTILYYPDDASWGVIAKVKLDLAGNVTYKKRLNKSHEVIPMHQRMVVDGNNMYAAGEASNSIVIERFDSSGIRTWTKRIVNGTDQTVRIEGTYLIGDSLYVTARVSTLVGWIYKHNVILVKIGKDGSGMNSVLIQQDLVNDHLPFFISNNLRVFHTALTHDGNFILADRIPGSSDSAIALIKFSPEGKILWAKKYAGLKQHLVMSVHDDGSGLTIVGAQLYSYNNRGENLYNPLLIHTDYNGEVRPDSGTLCNAVPFTTTTSPFKLVQNFGYLPPTPNFEYLDFGEHWYHPEERLLETVPTFTCGIKANCSRITLSGPSSVCGKGDLLVYNAQRNVGCTSPVSWRFDTAYVHMVDTSGTSLKVRYKQAGVTKIYLLIQTPCGVYIDSVAVTVLPRAEDLTLGKDTTLCTGNSVVLNAKKGYVSYKWQDGSADSTFVVTQPGLYHVTVQGLCGSSYTDSIWVRPHPPIPFDLGPDRVKCNNDTLHFQAPAGFSNYRWGPNYQISTTTAANVVVSPLVDTSYFVQAEKTPGCFAYDTVRIRIFHSPVIQLGNDTTFCQGSSLLLHAGGGFAEYRWNTGDEGAQLSVTNKGEYSVEAITNEGCRSTDTLQVTSVYANPNVALGNDKTLCSGSKRTLDAGIFSHYLWSDGNHGRTLIVDRPGLYWVQVQDQNGCAGGDTLDIDRLLPQPKEFLPRDTAICSYGTLMLKPVQSFTQYAWNNGSSAASLSVDRPGTYSLEVKDSAGCTGKDEIMVYSKECMKGLFVPNAFTPNKDGKNDLFKPLLFGSVKLFHLTVYNRWGEVVFDTDDRQRGWDGSYKGKQLDSNVFVWICRYQLEGEEPKMEKGSIVVIR